MKTYNSLDDKALVVLLQQDNVDAFTELYNRFWKKIYIAVYAILQNREASLDIVQDIFISLWERRCQLEIYQPGAYLMQAARYQVFKAIRANKMHAGFYQRLTAVSVKMVDENPMLFKELSATIDKILFELPEDHRKAFLLSRDAGLSYKEIAGKMNISQKTVEKKISRTLKRLRLGLDEAFLLLPVFLILFPEK